jgi:hypothetical protein
MHGETEGPSKDWKFLLKASGVRSSAQAGNLTKLDAFVFYTRSNSFGCEPIQP